MRLLSTWSFRSPLFTLLMLCLPLAKANQLVIALDTGTEMPFAKVAGARLLDGNHKDLGEGLARAKVRRAFATNGGCGSSPRLPCFSQYSERTLKRYQKSASSMALELANVEHLFQENPHLTERKVSGVFFVADAGFRTRVRTRLPRKHL